MERYKDLSMTSKISLAFINMLLPFAILMGFWFTNMLKSNEFYRKASQNTSVISEFSLDFKKNYDYKIYLIIVGNKSYESQKPIRIAKGSSILIKARLILLVIDKSLYRSII